VNARPLPRPSADGSGRDGEPLRVSVTYHADNAAVHAAGELDGPGGEALRSVIGQLALARLRRVELDLSRVTSADLSGVRALDEFRIALAEVGTELRISHYDSADYPLDWHSVPPAERRDRGRSPKGRR
jgi:anti-anti-sigma regulatory factor